jgi:hypothetical protein
MRRRIVAPLEWLEQVAMEVVQPPIGTKATGMQVTKATRDQSGGCNMIEWDLDKEETYAASYFI